MADERIATAFARIKLSGFIGAALPVSDLDLPRLGHLMGVGEDEVHAVIDVETTGSGFDKADRPKMLFEPHKFYAKLSGAARANAVALGIAYPKWGTRPYPADSYPRLRQAMAIDETAALASASWGMGQILGENFVAAGYTSPQHMVVAFVESGETEHLGAMVRFILANKLDDELRAHNWSGFARGYNGPQYAANGYHTKLAAAFAKWSKIKDTPWKPEDDMQEAPSMPTPPVNVLPVPPLDAAPAPALPAPPAAVVVPVPTVPGAAVAVPAPETRTLWQRVTDRLRAAYPVKKV